MLKTIVIEGLNCQHCVHRVEKALNAIDGVKAEVDLNSKSASVTAPDTIEDKVLTDAIADAGYEVVSID
ncbi:MAG: heavy-metal-associated domain-containing protein [Deferribacteraceae bacterium]|jgi:copper ion binding protein|nr:heavy-metal-associated domain-containing protein [Deferribacteraceae bacterium]